MYRIPLSESLFDEEPQVVLQSDEFIVTAFVYPQNIAASEIANSRSFVEVLPLMGQIIWDAVFDGKSLRMSNMFRKPQRGSGIVDTYGCFVFHSGLLTDGCPSPEDTHPLHGEFPCAPMDEAWLEVDESGIRVVSEYEYVRGFGHHYLVSPSIALTAGSPHFDIGMRVENLSAYQPMPLLHMCHMNYAYAEQGQMRRNLPDSAFQLRRTVPLHVHPTPQWQEFSWAIPNGEMDGSVLDRPDCYDPGIVYFADNLAQYGDHLEFEIYHPIMQTTFNMRFSSQESPHAARWILSDPNRKVAAFVLPTTARPEGYLTAEKAGTLQRLQPDEAKSFTVNTGIKDQSRGQTRV